MPSRKSRALFARPDAELTPAQRFAAGKALRETVPRSAHAQWQPAKNRPDPIELLIESSRTRVKELVPIRYGRMMTSPFAFFRGSAVIMAHDLNSTPVIGVKAQLCGDAHLSNFGLFATPERNIIFDVNDFDETLRGPWEWDLKRLAASCDIAARDNGLTRKQARRVAQASAKAYRMHIRDLAKLTYLDVWYSRIDITDALDVVPRSYYAAAKHEERDAIHETTHSTLPKFVARKSGKLYIKDEPPLIMHFDDAVRTRHLGTDLVTYAATLQEDRQVLLQRYRLIDLAIKVVGVGSVGTRCYVALMQGCDKRDALLLQVKEARASVLERHLGKSPYKNHGQRVVHGQRLMQAATDIFLGWARGVATDFYVRQLRDMKFSAAVQAMNKRDLTTYAQLCGRTLARAHARSGDVAKIAGYLGSGDVFDRAVADFTSDYADQNERDYHALLEAIKQRRIHATPGM